MDVDRHFMFEAVVEKVAVRRLTTAEVSESGVSPHCFIRKYSNAVVRRCTILVSSKPWSSATRPVLDSILMHVYHHLRISERVIQQVTSPQYPLGCLFSSAMVVVLRYDAVLLGICVERTFKGNLTNSYSKSENLTINKYMHYCKLVAPKRGHPYLRGKPALPREY